MKYLDPSFSLGYGSSAAYRDGWERTFYKPFSEPNYGIPHQPIDDDSEPAAMWYARQTEERTEEIRPPLRFHYF